MIKRKVPFHDEPFYPPGYCGYNPQYAFRYGDPFGRATAKLLTDPTVAKSGNPILAEIVPTRAPRPDEHRRISIRSIKQSWGDRLHNDPMVPGYTGYIPKQAEYFGRRYAKICSKASDAFFEDTTDHMKKRLSIPYDENLPLTPLAVPGPRKPLSGPTSHDLAVGKLGDKPVTFCTGYTGYIPHAKFKFAEAYRTVTHKALAEFDAEQRREKSLARVPIVISRDVNPGPVTGQQVYKSVGQPPNYTGYLPGHMYRFGMTYGQSSRYFSDTGIHGAG